MAGGARARRSLAATAALLALLVALAPLADAGKGKGKRKAGALKARTFSSGPLALAVPDDPGVNAEGAVQTAITVGKALKGRTIDDVNASLRVSHPDIDQLRAELTAPNGATVELVGFTTGASWGSGPADCGGAFLTLDDETPVEISNQATPSFQQLGPPYAGVAQPDDFFKPLAVMDGGPVRGTWTLTLRDTVPGQTATLHCWQVRVKPRRGSKR